MTLLHVGVDPGTSTGLAVLLDGEPFYATQGTPEQMMAILSELLATYPPPAHRAHVGTERFVITPKTGKRTQQTAALEVTGIVDFIVTEAGHPTPVRQTIPEVKKFASNALLDTLGWRVSARTIGTSDADDANDAIRHATYLLAQTNPAIFGELLRRARVIG